MNSGDGARYETRPSVAFAAGRQLPVGAAAGAITYGLGRLLGVSLGG